jgi:hypothetical protein
MLDELYWTVHAKSWDNANVVAIGEHGVAVIHAAITAREAAGIALAQNERVAKKHGLDPRQFREIVDVLHFVRVGTEQWIIPLHGK